MASGRQSVLPGAASIVMHSPLFEGGHNAAVEFKYRNISAVLLMLGCLYIDK